MEKVLLISSASSLQERLTDLLGSPRHIARISSWAEALRVLTATPPVAVILGPEMVDPSQVSQIIGLNNILQDHNRPCFVLVPTDDPQGGEWLHMFDSVALVTPQPTKPGPWADFIKPIRALLNTNNTNKADPSPTASPAPAKAPPAQFLIQLPSISQGELSNTSLARLLYSLHIQGATGLLRLQTGSVKRTFAFAKGDLITAPNFDSIDALLSAFAWPRGAFIFKNHQPPPGSKLSIFSIIQQGLSLHRPQRLVMDAIMPMMATFPTITQLYDDRKSLLSWPVLERLLGVCDGQKSLETLLSSMGHEVTHAFRAALFASDTDLIIFHDEPTSDESHVKYKNQGPQSPSPSQPSPAADKNRAQTSAHRQMEEKLRSFHRSISSMSPYEIFDIWEGCGREVVKETFYSMVKEHHPDVHGGNASENIKDLAQKIFVQIRRAYTQLMALEGEQTVPPPSAQPRLSHRQTPGRRQITTLHPGQVSPVQAEHNRGLQEQSAPIGLGRTPTDLHPDLTSRRAGRTHTTRPQRTTTNHPPRRSLSQSGLSDISSDPEWRREQMERLERKPSRPLRRPTPIAAPTGSIPPPVDPAQEAFNTGYQLFKQHHFHEALPHLEEAHKKEPHNSLFMTFYAYCLFQSDPAQRKTSQDLLEKAIASNHPQALPDAHLFLGLILKINGHEQKAFQHFQRALELNPASRDAEREVRRHKMRHGKNKQETSRGGFFRNLFKKDS